MNTPNSYNDELLSAYLDGELTGDEQALVEERLASDPSAQQLLDDLAMMREDLQSLPTYSLPHDLSERVLQQAEHEMLVPRNDSPMPISKAAPTSWKKLAWALLVAGAAASIAIVIFYGPGGDEGPRVAGGPSSSEISTGPLHASGEGAEDNLLAASTEGIGGGKSSEEFYLQGRDSEENGKRVDDDFASSNQKLPAANGPAFKGRSQSKKGGNAGEDRFGNLANGSEFDLDAVAGQGTYEGKDAQGVANGIFYAGAQATANGRQPLPDNTYTVAMTTGDFREQVIEQSLRYQELTSPTLLGTERFSSPAKQLSGGAVAKATDDRKLDLDGDASESAAPDLAEHRQGKNDAKAKDAGVEQKEDSSPRYVYVEGTPEQINKLLAKLGPAAVETSPGGKYGLQESALKTNSRGDEHLWHSANDSVDEKQPEVQDRSSNAAKDQPQNNAPISPAKPATPNTTQPQAKPTDPTPEPTVVAPVPPGAPQPVPPTSNLANGDAPLDDPFDSPIGKNASPADKSEPGRSEDGQGAASDPNTVNSPKTAGNFRSKADNQTLQEESPNAAPSEAEGEEIDAKTQRGRIVENANRSLDGHLKESQQVLDQTVVTPKSEVTANEENATQGERLEQSVAQSKHVTQDDSEKREPSQSFSLNASRQQSRGTVRVLFVLYDATAVRANSIPAAAKQLPASR